MVPQDKRRLLAVAPSHRLGLRAFQSLVEVSPGGGDAQIDRYLDGGWSAEFPDGAVLILTPDRSERI